MQRPGAEPLVATLGASPDGHFSGLISGAKAGGRYRYRIDSMGPFPRFRCRASLGLARFGPTTPKQLGAVTVHELMVISIHTRIEPRSYFPAASVDPTDARNDILGCFRRSDRSALGQTRPRAPACQ